VSVLLQYRFVLVIALLAIAAALLADSARLPLVLRGLQRAVGKGARADSSKPISTMRRIIAFALVVLAFLVAVVEG
jgi:hypothetical protein